MTLVVAGTYDQFRGYLAARPLMESVTPCPSS
jgi:hypothetical protein